MVVFDFREKVFGAAAAGNFFVARATLAEIMLAEKIGLPELATAIEMAEGYSRGGNKVQQRKKYDGNSFHLAIRNPKISHKSGQSQ